MRYAQLVREVRSWRAFDAVWPTHTGAKLDLNGDGKVSYGEFMEGMDKDMDGTVTIAEYDAAQQPATKSAAK